MNKLIDLTGKRFGRWTVASHSHIKKYGRCTVHFWKCVCDCGNEGTPTSKALRAGDSQSCGCLQIERTSAGTTTHGLSKLPEYRLWVGMLNRCRNPNVKSFPDYGGRGITVCDRWHDFPAFYEDMGQRPSAKHSIDRIDSNGNYEPSNCRWANPREQANNTRRNVRYELNGKTQTLSEWARDVDISVSCLKARISRRGWSIEKALTQKKAG